MKTATTTALRKTATLAMIGLLSLAASNANAGVKFRVAYNATNSTYSVYMKPDAVPNPDLTVSSQLTFVVPHDAAQPVEITNVKSLVTNANWVQNSRVDAPTENTTADYISLGYYASGSAPQFGWVANTEQRVLTFKSPQGCIAGLKLMANSDPFNQLPNSVDTNPGNEMTNYGWGFDNAYTGNYGQAVSCSATAAQ